ncbi:MAG TPA: C-terminal binding protein, partial [Chloroflexota bacterium]
IGVDNVDVGAATEHGIVVANVPGFCVEELADHAMALVLAFARQVVTYRDSTRGGAWDTFVTPRPLQRLAGQTLGLIGFGASARAVARRARAFGLRVLAYTPRLTAERAGEHQVEAVSLATLLRESDYVSIHCPLTSETRHLIGWSELQRMKPTAYLINTARGAIVDEEALVRALDEGVIAGAGLDVLVAEPPAPEHPLLHRDNVIVTPHAAFYSEQALLDLQARAARAVADVLDGRMPESIVNREVLGRARARLAP